MINHVENIEEYRRLKSNAFYPFEKTEGYDERVIQDILSKKLKLRKLKSEIAKTPMEVVDKYRDSIRGALRKILLVINGHVNNLPLDKDQGTVISGMVYVKFNELLDYALKRPSSSWNRNFYYTDNPERQLNSTDLEEAVELLIETFDNSSFKNYFELEEFTEGIIDEIKEIWRKNIN